MILWRTIFARGVKDAARQNVPWSFSGSAELRCLPLLVPRIRIRVCAGVLKKSAFGVETQEARINRSTNKTSAETSLCGGLVCPGQTQTVSLIHYISRMFFHIKLCLVLPPKRFCPFIRCRQKRLYIAFHIKVMPEGKIVILFKGGGEVEEVL